MQKSLPARVVIVAALAITASGRSSRAEPPFLWEQFSSGSLPPGWSNLDNAGEGARWAFNNPGGRGNSTGGTGGFAIADSDFAGPRNMDTMLVTPGLNLTGMAGVYLRFRTAFNVYDGPGDVTDEVGDVDLSINGGATWTNVWRHREADGDVVGQAVLVPLPAADNQSDVRVRFRYHGAYYDYFWEVDDVRVEPEHVFGDGFEP